MTVRIPLRDEAELTWFFLWGQHKFERSVHGAMVDRLERDSMGSHRCHVCHGYGVIEDKRALAMHTLRGKSTERVDREEAHLERGIWTTRKVTEGRPVHEGSECQFCHGTGWRPAVRRRPRCDCWGQPRMVRALCPTCLGTGTPQLSARPVCMAHEAGGTEPDGETLKRFAAISRRLAMIPPSHRLTLERYYGPHGQSWAAEPCGRLLGLFEFTSAGRGLLRRTRRKGDDATGASPAERLASQVDLQASSPETWRRESLDACADQAVRLVAAAQAAWVAAGEPTASEALAGLVEAAATTDARWADWQQREWARAAGGGQ